MNAIRQKLTTTALLLVFLVCISTPALAAPGTEQYDESQMRYIDNGTIRLGVNLGLGGAITYIADAKTRKNVINNYDWGRQIQMSFFADPRPYTENGQQPDEEWAHIGWNPIQAGDVAGNGSKVVAFEKTDTTLYVKCIPMQWPLDNIPGECTYECWVDLQGSTAQVRGRLNNARSDTTQYAGRHQELPAVYTNGELYRLMTYCSDKPFSGDSLTRIRKKQGGGFPWKYWLATENWAALVDKNDWGLGIYKPENYLFIGGFSGLEGRGGTFDNQTGYISPLHTEVLDHNIIYDYRYDLILGHLDDIRSYAVGQGKRGKLPDWRFDHDRQHWHYQMHGGSDGEAPHDAGWPIEGHLQLDLAKKGIAAVSPPTFWKAEATPLLHLECAFRTSQAKSSIWWSPFSEDDHHHAFSADRRVEFDIIGDGEFRTYSVDLSAVPNYTGPLSYLMFKPVEKEEQGGWVKIKRIWFSEHP